jgi:hypothetical protein
MNPLLLSSIFDIGRSILDRVFPDPQQRASAELELLKAQQEGAFREMDAELQRSLAQTNVNAIEAANPNLFVSGWRPAIGWIGASALAYHYLLRPLVPWLCNATGHPVPDMPGLDGGLFELVSLMLGMGGLRTLDKRKALDIASR